MFELQICSRTGKVLKAFALGGNQEVIVGRDESCDIQINAKSVSREHCAIESLGDEMFIRDLGSTIGTFMNGSKIEKVRLEDGVQVEVGPAILKFIDAGI